MKHNLTRLFSLLLLAAMSMGAMADTFAWLVGNESSATVTSDKAEYVSQTKVTVGTGLTVGTKDNYAANNGNMMVTYQPATGNAGSKPEVMIEYSLLMQKGVAFQLTSIAYDAIKDGTDNATYSWSYTVDGTESDITTVSKDDLLRNNNTSGTPALRHEEAVTDAAGQKVTVRFYVSGFGNNKKFALSNIVLTGTINGEPEVRAFKDIKVDFRTDPAIVLLPESGELPEGVTIPATFHDNQHGISNGTITVPVDGPVKFTFGTCKHGAQSLAIQKDGNDLTTISTFGDPCDSNTSYDKFVTWTYNSEQPATLTFTLSGYMPYFFAEATEFVPQVEVRYYDVDGTTLIGSEVVEGGSALAYKYSENDVTVAAGKAFRGWFTSADKTSTKVPQGTILNEDLKLCAHATDIEVAKVGAVFEYDLRPAYFYPEDHELLSMTKSAYKDAQHGWQFSSNGTLSVEVAGNAVVRLSLCKYGNAGELVCTDAKGNPVGEAITLPVETDGGIGVIRYTGAATTLTFTLTNGGYVHAVKVFNIAEIPTKNEAGYYVLSANDGAGLLLLLETAQNDDKIFLPNGTYDFGSTTLTEVTKSISLIGQSMEGVLIVNHPLEAGMNKAETLHFLTGGLYLQDLAIRCDVSYEGSKANGVGIAVQDRGDKNIYKRVSLQGNQDTYLSNGTTTQRGWFEDCRIEGTVDYICGVGNIWFENTLFYNNARSSADVIFAPATAAATVYGYVVNNCTIDGADNQAGKWNIARGWKDRAAVTLLNTTCLIAPSAKGYTNMTAGLKVRFHEFNTHLEDGTVITGHNLDGLGYDAESDPIYLDSEGVYTYANVILGADNWDAKAIAAQVKADAKAIDAEAAYLVEDEGAFVAVVKGSQLSDDHKGKTIRQANTRGGFGEAVLYNPAATAIEAVSDQHSAVSVQKVIRDGQLIILRDGMQYNTIGQMIQ